MKLFNTALLKPRNVAVIAGVAILAHAFAKPLFRIVGNKGE